MSAAAAEANDLAFSLRSGIPISAGIYSRLTPVSAMLSEALEQCVCCTKAAASWRRVPVRTRMSKTVPDILWSPHMRTERLAAALSYQN